MGLCWFTGDNLSCLEATAAIGKGLLIDTPVDVVKGGGNLLTLGIAGRMVSEYEAGNVQDFGDTMQVAADAVTNTVTLGARDMYEGGATHTVVAKEISGVAGIERGADKIGEGIGLGDADLVFEGIGEFAGGTGQLAGWAAGGAALGKRAFGALSMDEFAGAAQEGMQQFSREMATTPGAAQGGATALQHARWAGNVGAINATVDRIGRRALRQSGGDWVQSEALFRRYLGGVEGRLRGTGSSLGIEWQPAAIPGQGRVSAFRLFTDRSGARRVFATKGSRRLDAGLVDLTQPGRFRPLVSGYDITLNSAKPSIVRYYQEAFGDIPILDIRISGS